MSNKGCVDCAEAWPVGDEACNCARADGVDGTRVRRASHEGSLPARFLAQQRIGTGCFRSGIPPMQFQTSFDEKWTLPFRLRTASVQSGTAGLRGVLASKLAKQGRR
jgi:hypothetical protein